MDQATLNYFENLCTEDDPPFCMAACPFHLDGRALTAAIRQGDWAGAGKIISVLPWPNITGRLCDGPCQKACRRGENNLGGPIRMPFLENIALENGPPLRKPLKLPPKERRAIIYGEDLAALTAVWDLVRKGFQTTLIHPKPHPAPEVKQRLGDLVDAEIERLKELGAFMEQGSTPDIPELAQKAPSPDVGYFRLGPAADYPVNPISLNALPGLFLFDPARLSASDQALAGRRAAISLERWLQGASLTSSREAEGPQSSRLPTNLADYTPLPAVEPQSGNRYTPEEAKAEAERCLNCHCLECLKICPYLKHYGKYPRQYARLFYNNMALIQGGRTFTVMVNSCSLCGRCAQICPNGFDMSKLARTARHELQAKKLIAPAVHEFALHDLESALSVESALRLPAPAREKSSRYFFPGCQLGAGSPGQVQAAYEYLLNISAGDMGLWLSCCGSAWDWAERPEERERHWNNLIGEWRTAGEPELILACAYCGKMFAQNAPQIKTSMIWQIFLEKGLPEGAGGQGLFSLHDSCAAVGDETLQDQIRHLAGRLGLTLREPKLTRDLTDCCGFGGLAAQANPEVAALITSGRLAEAGQPLLTYCAMCQEHFRSAGGEAWYMMDFIFPEAERGRASLSQRRDNRRRLKETLIMEKWPEKQTAFQEPPWFSKKLLIADDLRLELEKRRILDQDIAEVLYEAEKRRTILKRPDQDVYLAVHRPRHVTFWVEYQPAGPEEYRVIKAWSHRMSLPQIAHPA